jgi:CubicO group peptidase (beta-lactamase class C family)
MSASNKSKPTDDTLYEVGSITKVFTGLLLADAIVRGEVNSETKLNTLLPASYQMEGKDTHAITLEMLSTHSAGLPRQPKGIDTSNFRTPYENYNEAHLWSDTQLVQPVFTPGERSEYSNFGGGLLGAVLARNAKTSYEQLLKSRIVSPLGMTSTKIKLSQADRKLLAPPHTSKLEPWQNWEFDALAAAGGVRSTLADMLRLADAFLNGTEVKGTLDDAIALAWQKQDVTKPIVPGGQCLGWMVAGDGQTRWHNGQTGGYHSVIFINRRSKTAVVVLANASNPIVTAIGEAVIRQVAVSRPGANIKKTIRLPVADLKRCEGTFAATRGMVLRIEVQQGRLFVVPQGQGMDQLYPTSRNTFISKRAPIEVEFTFDEQLLATEIAVRQNGRTLNAKRVED